MKLHYNQDGSIQATLNIKGKKINMIFKCEEDYNNFLEILF